MGIFKKIKDIFYDEEVVEVPVEQKKESLKFEEKEEIKPAIQNITPEIEKERVYSTDEEPRRKKNIDAFSERELFKSEKTFDFPVFEEEEPVKTRSKTNVLELQKELEERALNSRTEEPKKKYERIEEKKESSFKPSPVISPIYGILDKNYKKEQVIEKKEISKPHKGDINYDYVRRKAYGTLEDELEDTLTRVNSEIVQNVSELEKELEELPKPSENIEKLLGEIEKNANVSIGDLEEKAKDKMLEEEEKEVFEEQLESKKEEKEDFSEKTLEHDLFNLIDSMYEDKEE